MPIDGTPGDDTLDGTSGNDTINGLAGNDTIRPNTGGDRVYGGGGGDVIHFGPGQFVPVPGFPDSGDDYVNGGTDNDELVLDGDFTGLLSGLQLYSIETVRLLRGTPMDFNTFTIAVAGSFQNLNALTVRGEQLATPLTFDGSAQTSSPYAPPRFTIYGGEAADALRGGAREDWIHGGAGADTMFGGSGHLIYLSYDTFAYTDAGDSTLAETDTIGDFGSRDRIDLTEVDAITGTPAEDDFAWSVDANFHNVAGELRYRPTSATSGFLEGDTDGNGSADLSIAITFTGGHVFSREDVIVAPAPLKTDFDTPGNWGAQLFDYTTTYVGDFNGDGKDDLYNLNNRRLYLSDGDSFYPGDIIVPHILPPGYRYHIGDFDGDGLDDAFRYTPGIGNEMFRSSPDGGILPDWIWTDAWIGDADWTVGDFNGDGEDDIFRYLYGSSGADMFLSDGTRFAPDGSWTPAGFGARGWFTGDFDGDGMDDIFRYLPGQSGADMWLSTGSGFAHAGSWTSDEPGAENWNVGDFNGDGMDDIFRYLEGQSGADVFLSTGSAFVHDGSWTGAGHGAGFWSIGDFDGDGSSDLVRLAAPLPGEVLVSAEVLI